MLNATQQEKSWFKDCLNNQALVEKIKKIKLIITDIDGVLTDGQILINKDVDSKSFSVQDGYITAQTLKNNLLSIAFLSGRDDESTKIRAKKLGIPEDMCYVGFCSSKIEKTKDIQKLKNVLPEETLFFGDDYLDIQVKPSIGILVCPTNAPFYFQPVADILVPRDGGNHVFRLLLDLVLYIQNKHPFAQEFIEKSLK